MKEKPRMVPPRLFLCSMYSNYHFYLCDLVQLAYRGQLRAVIWRGTVKVPNQIDIVLRDNVCRFDNGFWVR